MDSQPNDPTIRVTKHGIIIPLPSALAISAREKSEVEQEADQLEGDHSPSGLLLPHGYYAQEAMKRVQQGVADRVKERINKRVK